MKVSDKTARNISVTSSLILLFLLALWLGRYSHHSILGPLQKPVQALSDIPSQIKEISKEIAIRQNRLPEALLYPDYFPGKSGIVKATDHVQEGYLLISRLSAKENQFIVELMNKVTGEIIHTWIPSYEAIYKSDHKPLSEDDAQSVEHMRIIHPLLLRDGSLIVLATGGRLVRLDKDSRVMWQIDHEFHHSINMDHEGNVWVPSKIIPGHYRLHEIFGDRTAWYTPEKISVDEESLVKVNQEGKILKEISLLRVLLENGLKSKVIFKWTQKYRDDITHLNDIQPVLEDTNFARKGDLFLSLRVINAVLQYRPSEDKIVWYQVGPWIAQHDVTIDNMDEISVLSNERRLEPYDRENRSRVITFNFKDGTAREPYAESTERADFFVYSEGLQTVLPDGNVLLEETVTGRILELSKDAIEWEYVNRYDDKHLGNIAWSRFVPKEDVDARVFE